MKLLSLASGVEQSCSISFDFLRAFCSVCPQLQIGEQLGIGSTGRLVKGKYLSQDVAIKIIEIGDSSASGSDKDHQTALAAERLQIYKQEISIMRWECHVYTVFVSMFTCGI